MGDQGRVSRESGIAFATRVLCLHTNAGNHGAGLNQKASSQMTCVCLRDLISSHVCVALCSVYICVRAGVTKQLLKKTHVVKRTHLFYTYANERVAKNMGSVNINLLSHSGFHAASQRNIAKGILSRVRILKSTIYTC